jgi:Arc/MetJ-type ribon-helix-helix transcriptional regulator
MFRTQVYLTEQEHEGLRDLAESTDKSQSELIREAVDRLLESERKDRREAIIEEAAGMWGRLTARRVMWARGWPESGGSGGRGEAVDGYYGVWVSGGGLRSCVHCGWAVERQSRSVFDTETSQCKIRL